MATFLYMTLPRKIYGGTNEFFGAGGLQTVSFNKKKVAATEIFGLTCRGGAHNSRYAHDTRSYPIFIFLIQFNFTT